MNLQKYALKDFLTYIFDIDFKILKIQLSIQIIR